MFTETDHPFPPAALAPRCLPGGATLAVLAIRDNLRRSLQNVTDCDANRARRRMNRQAVVSCELLPSVERINLISHAIHRLLDLDPHCDDCQRNVADCACAESDSLVSVFELCDL